MNTVLFCVYAAVTLVAVIFTALREFHMFQLNGYKTPEHTRWMLKNKKRYIWMIFLFCLQFSLLYTGVNIVMVTGFTLFNLGLLIFNRPGKKFKKPLVYTARVKRMLVTFFIFIAVFYVLAVLLAKENRTVYIDRIWNEAHTDFTYSDKYTKVKWFGRPISYILVGSSLLFTPLLVLLSNFVNKPIEKAVQNWYINDAKRMLKDMPKLHKVGITGSYGKTSMKFYLSELLSSKYETLKTPESYNTPMGVVKTIRMFMKPTHEYFICEMGARRVGEIRELCDIVSPHDAIITSVGPQHLETFKSIENVTNTKFELADSISPLGKIYLNGDNEYIRGKAPNYKNAVTYGLSEDNDYRATDISVSETGTEFTVTAPDGETCKYSTKLLGEHNVQNILGAIAYAHGTGIPLDKLVLPVRRIQAVPHRLQLLDKGGGVTFIDDAYNSNPNGCRAALGVLKLFDACRILVTPGMVELGAKQEELNREFGREAAEVCDYIALVGREQTVPIFNGIKEAGYDMSRVYVADSLGDALAKVQAYQTDKKKIVLLENDLPDNY